MRGCGVQRVEDLEFQRLPWPDLGDEIHADVVRAAASGPPILARAPTGRTAPHARASGPRDRCASIGPEFVVGRGTIRSTMLDGKPTCSSIQRASVGSRMLGELGHHARSVVPLAVRLSRLTTVTGGPPLSRRSRAASTRWPRKRSGVVRVGDVVGDVGQRGVEAPGRRVPAVALLGHGHRDEWHRRERRAQLGRLGRGVEDGVDRADDAWSHVVAVDDAERVEPVLRFERAAWCRRGGATRR